jgi:hypothetical protein
MHAVAIEYGMQHHPTGRLVMGYVPEAFLHSSGTPRPVFLVSVAAGMVRWRTRVR